LPGRAGPRGAWARALGTAARRATGLGGRAAPTGGHRRGPSGSVRALLPCVSARRHAAPHAASRRLEASRRPGQERRLPARERLPSHDVRAQRRWPHGPAWAWPSGGTGTRPRPRRAASRSEACSAWRPGRGGPGSLSCGGAGGHQRGSSVVKHRRNPRT
jgi:hypothetical protein